ncbi:glucosamine inositolphosphorylceramide transferase family protein [Salimicrobium flavidum]|uniref:Glucosamine inositolphosphorylceramide transferase 1 N-terminal domain-containing protein n=1 Tax=Salimicrobium flavidum TaxID=570947 RepID=A0A1N7KNH2_9BACI|nr:hypothetical protein [Salimicrobium flavidum]SIS63010.1 hypothetical protein SAMN05421687_11435 [Salimicrobium flavidum]
MKRQVKAGIIIDNYPPTSWEKQILQSIRDAQHIELSFIIYLNNKKREVPDIGPGSEKIIKGSVTSQGMANDSTLTSIQGHTPDWILSLSKTRLNGGILTLPAWGVWTFRHLAERIPFSGDFLNRSGSTSVFLDSLEADGKVRPLMEGCISVNLHSYHRHMKKVEEITRGWATMVSEKWRYGLMEERHPLEIATSQSAVADKGRIFHTEMIWKAKRMKRKLFGYEYWNVGQAKQSLESILQGKGLEVEWFKQDRDLYYADPFLYHDGDKNKIIMEEVDYRSVKGFITEWSIVDDEISSEERATIHNGTHLSYPYIIRDKGELYCVPENSERGEVTLYKYEEKGWEQVQTILKNFSAVDSTIFNHEGRWWLFCTRGAGLNRDNEELHIFYADQLIGPWLPHKGNPVKVDVRSSRPAGAPFSHKGTLYRPAQDCSVTYGGAVVVNRIEKLSPFYFKEMSVSRIEPEKSGLYPDGVHTISVTDGMIVVDGKRTEYHVKHLLKKLYYYRPVPLEKVLTEPLTEMKKYQVE